MNTTASSIGLSPGFGSVPERRAAAERASEEREQWRIEQVREQVAPHKSPQERIEVWEKFHGLGLPRTANHKLLNVIATQTQLSLSDVFGEQQRRAARNAV